MTLLNTVEEKTELLAKITFMTSTYGGFVLKLIFYCCFYRQWALDHCLPNHIIKL